MTNEKFYFEREVFSKKGYNFNFTVDKELINDILELKKEGKVLDLGCGEGGNSLELAKRGFDVTCIDISKTAVQNIKEFAKKNKIKINVICADIEKYNLIQKYDVIIGTGTFHFFTKEVVDRLIKKIRESTKKGGVNIFNVFLEGDPTQKDNLEGYYFQKKELLQLYLDWKIKIYEEYDDFDEDEGTTNKMAKIIVIKR
jgi:tellurite methyltransferase